MKCLHCNKKANYIYDGDSFCKAHYLKEKQEDKEYNEAFYNLLRVTSRTMPRWDTKRGLH